MAQVQAELLTEETNLLCLWCGQHFMFNHIQKMRSKAWVEKARRSSSRITSLFILWLQHSLLQARCTWHTLERWKHMKSLLTPQRRHSTRCASSQHRCKGSGTSDLLLRNQSLPPRCTILPLSCYLWGSAAARNQFGFCVHPPSGSRQNQTGGLDVLQRALSPRSANQRRRRPTK